jgi:hypothetical protein
VFYIDDNRVTNNEGHLFIVQTGKTEQVKLLDEFSRPKYAHVTVQVVGSGPNYGY